MKKNIRSLCLISAVCITLSSLVVPQPVKANSRSDDAIKKIQENYNAGLDYIEQQARKEQERRKDAEKWALEQEKKRQEEYRAYYEKKYQEELEKKERQAQAEKARQEAWIKYYQEYYKNQQNQYQNYWNQQIQYQNYLKNYQDYLNNLYQYNNVWKGYYSNDPYKQGANYKDGIYYNNVILEEGDELDLGNKWNLVFWSSNSKIASVNNKGVIEANNKGTCVIIGKSYDSKITIYTYVTVR